MQYSCGLARRVSAFLGLAIAASVLAIQVQSAQAQTTEEKWTVTTASSDNHHPGKPTSSNSADALPPITATCMCCMGA